jgi:hypothetical protein
MRKLFIGAVLAFVAAAGGVALATESASDPVLGTWELNVAKSTFTAGSPMKRQTRTYTQSGQGMKLIIKTMGADGAEVTSQTTYRFDGKDHPVTGTPDYDTISAQQVDSHTARFTLKKGGKPVGASSRTVSKDGKMLTVKLMMTTAKGEKSESVLMLDRQ